MSVRVHFYPFQRHVSEARRERRRRAGTALVAALLSALMLGLPFTAFGAPTDASEEQKVRVVVRHSAPSYSPGDTIATTVTVGLSRPASYLEVRLRMRTPGGRLVWQKTEIRHEVASPTVDFGFTRESGGSELREGRYPLEFQVRATGAEPTELTDRVFVVEPDTRPVPVALVVRILGASGTDTAGRFIEDPAFETRGRDDAIALARLLGNRGPRVSLAVSPVVLEDWRRISGGYAVVGPAGLRSVPASSPVALSYGTALEKLAGSIRAGRMELLDVPYADPDMHGLLEMDAMGDLRDHYERGRSAYLASLNATPSAGTAILGDRFPSSSLSVLGSHGVRYALVSTASLEPRQEPHASGSYRLRHSRIGSVVLDSDLSRLVSHADTATPELLDRLFERAVSNETTAPMAAVLTLGPGGKGDASRLAATLAALSRIPWVRMVTVGEAAGRAGDSTVSLRDSVQWSSRAPADHWQEVAQSRQWARGLTAALPPEDPDADAASRAILVAESRSWAGSNGDWSLADLGLSYSASASRIAHSVFDRVSIAARDVTLSGQSGKVPITINNTSKKALTVLVRLRPANGNTRTGESIKTKLGPADNFLEIPVDLGSALSDRLTIQVVSGDLLVSEQSVVVRYSYLDRLAIVGTVVLVLLGMLLYIRRRLASVSDIEVEAPADDRAR